MEAILDGAERLLQRREQPSILAVAGEAGVSRPTVYAHFRDRDRLIEALVERAASRASEAIDAAELERGSALQALQRLLAASWEQLGRHEDWLVTSCLALIHAAAEEVRVGELDRGAALDALCLTVADVFTGRGA